MVCKNSGVYRFLGPAWVLITMALRNSVSITLYLDALQTAKQEGER